jgi:hypothetical protein
MAKSIDEQLKLGAGTSRRPELCSYTAVTSYPPVAKGHYDMAWYDRFAALVQDLSSKRST